MLLVIFGAGASDDSISTYLPYLPGTIVLILVLVLSRLPKQKRLKVLESSGRLLSRAFHRTSTHHAAQGRALIERNQDLIAKWVGLITPSGDPRHVEHMVRSCISEVAGREGKRKLAPEHEWLSQWEQRRGIPVEYLELKTHLLSVFSARHSEVWTMWRQRDQAEQKRLEDLKHEELVARNQDLIDKFLEIAERKVSVLDDYGDEQWDALPNEVKLCLKKIVQREGLIDKWNQAEHWAKAACKPGGSFGPRWAYGKAKELRILLGYLPQEYRWMGETLTQLFREYHEHMKMQIDGQPDLGSLSGAEFETHIARLLISAGYDVVGTPKTGDQGADLIAKKDGKKVIIQAKRYQGPVGNKAVQEVISALSFYGGDEGWVVTNSTFTTSAKALAQKAGIRLIDGRALETEQQ
jgi:Restriction endonuclease